MDETNSGTITAGRSGYVLGVNFSHDRSACLLEDGRIVTAIAEERLDRIKRSEGCLYIRGRKGGRTVPNFAISYCLESGGIGIDDLDLMVIDHALTPVDLNFLRAMIPMRDKERLRALPHPSHHLAHARAAYDCSGFEDAAVLVADAFGSVTSAGIECESGYRAEAGHLKPVFKNYQATRREQFLSLTGSYRLISQILGFVLQDLGDQQQLALDEAGKTMGLAGHGSVRPEWPPFIRFTEESGGGQHSFTMDFTGLLDWLETRELIRFDRHGPSGRLILQIAIRDSSAPLTDDHRDLATRIQAEFSSAMVELACRLHRATGFKRLCLSGGAALNSVANARIVAETPFEEVFIFPAATDDGNAVGCAYYGHHEILGHPWRPHRLRHPFLGRTYDTTVCEEAASRLGLLVRPLGSDEELIRHASRSLAEGRLVGWFQGGSEFGPRALGHRSILADPRRPEIPEILNRRVKSRESFRPFAPSVTVEERMDWFCDGPPSPWMLLVADVRPEQRKRIPAVTHVDGSARLQTVERTVDPLYHGLITAFGRASGVPVVLNTSMNGPGEPMVETPLDAARLFLRTELDSLYLGRLVIERDPLKPE